MQKEKILSVKNLRQYFKLDRHTAIKAVDDISFDIYKGEIFGLVGESGSGKSTTARSIMNLYKLTSGDIYYRDSLISQPEIYWSEKKNINRNMQIIFQNSTSALNSRMTVQQIIAEPLVIQKMYTKKQDRQAKVYELMDLVGLDRIYQDKYPYECSGGQRQRIGIARALSLSPEFIIADEPIASLDVSIQAQIINLFKKLQQEKEMTCLFISHDLGMVRYVCNRVAVMYRGKIVEMAETKELYRNPIHPYTKALFSAILVPDPNYVKKKKQNYENEDIDKYFYRENRLTEISAGHFVFCSDGEKAEENLNYAFC